MIWKVRWGNIEPFFKQKIGQGKTPLAKSYFERKKDIICFVRSEGQYFYSQIKKKDVDINSFKMEYLGNAYELLENPLNKKKTLVTKQELV